MSIDAFIDSIVTPVVYETPPDTSDGLPYVTHEGVIAIEGITLKVYVLSNGVRVIDKEDLENLFPDIFQQLNE